MDNQFAEQALLACLLSDGALSAEAVVDPADFENSQFALIYRSINAVISSDTAMDAITVADHMQDATGKNWLPILIELSQAAGVPENYRAYAAIIQAAGRSRKAAQIGRTLTENRNNPEVIQNAIRSLMEIGKAQSNHEYSLKEAMKLAIQDVDLAFRNPGAIVGVSTGVKDLDENLGGYHPGDLAIIGARPAVGKTAVMLNQIIGANKMVGCISGEQGVSQAAQRLLAIRGGVCLASMRNGRMDQEDFSKLEAAGGKLMTHPGIQFNDRPAPSIEEIEASARRWKYEYNIQALYVDYLQRIKRDPKKPKHEAVGDNAARLKELARELDIPVICLAQVKRDAQGRRPNMGDLADSSEIEKEADLIMLLYRDDEEMPGIMEFIIDKNRHGSTGLVPTQWNGRFLQIRDLERGRHS